MSKPAHTRRVVFSGWLFPQLMHRVGDLVDVLVAAGASDAFLRAVAAGVVQVDAAAVLADQGLEQPQDDFDWANAEVDAGQAAHSLPAVEDHQRVGITFQFILQLLQADL